MARPRKMTTEQMIEVVDSYYLTCCDGNEKLMKCSLIAEYAKELGYSADGYDFRRNLEVREHIERIKVFAETSKEVYGVKYQHSAYKSLDVEGFLRNNDGNDGLAAALRELDDYWRRVCEYSEQTAKQNRTLMQEKSSLETAARGLEIKANELGANNSALSAANNKLSVENRYLRKMLRTYLYPAVADEILRDENEPIQTDSEITDTAVHDFIGSGIPKSFEASVSKDNRLQSEAERLMERLWEKCDEET